MAKDKTLNIPTEFHTQIDAGSKFLKNDLLKVENKEYSIECGIADVGILDNTGIHILQTRMFLISLSQRRTRSKRIFRYESALIDIS